MPTARRSAPPRGLVAVAALLAGCGADSRDDVPLPEVRRVDLEAPGVRVGSFEGDAAALVPVGDLALATDGTLWAAQDQDRQIVAVSPRGAVLRRVGASGEGPGEFSSVGTLGWVGDTLWVADRRNRRVTFFGPAGEAWGDRPLLEPSPLDDGSTAEFRGLVAEAAVFTVGPGTAALMGPDAGRPGRDPVVVTARGGGAGRAVAVRFGVRERLILTRSAGGEIRGVFIFEQPWADASLLALDPDGRALVVVDRTVDPDDAAPAYRVTRIDLAGDTLWSVTRPYQPVPVDPVHRDSVVARYAAAGPGEEAVREALYLPATHPPVSRVFVGRDGRVWVGRERPQGASRRSWDVFDSRGRPVLTVTTSDRVELGAADAEAAWGVETDDFEVPYLVRYSLDGG